MPRQAGCMSGRMTSDETRTRLNPGGSTVGGCRQPLRTIGGSSGRGGGGVMAGAAQAARNPAKTAAAASLVATWDMGEFSRGSVGSRVKAQRTRLYPVRAKRGHSGRRLDAFLRLRFPWLFALHEGGQQRNVTGSDALACFKDRVGILFIGHGP